MPKKVIDDSKMLNPRSIINFELSDNMIMLNYKCKKEESPDGISNKCRDTEQLIDIDSKISSFMKTGSDAYKTRYGRDDAQPIVNLSGLNDSIKNNILDVLPDLEKTSRDLDIPMVRGIEAKSASSGMFGSANAFFGKINLSSSAIMGEYRSRSKKDKLSDWKLGDDIKNRPTFAVDYVDKNNMMKYYMYHEFAHHIHQTYGHQSGDTFNTGINPLEKEIEIAYDNRETASASKYADSNHFEWFAENYALHEVGRDDLVVPEARNLISKIEKTQKTTMLPGVVVTRTHRDIPNISWIQSEREYVKEKHTKTTFPVIGTLTSSFEGRLPVSMIKDLPGENDEHLNKEILTDFKAKPIYKSIKQEGVKEPITIFVNYKGDAYISEGNHRVAIANAVGLKDVPVDVRYFAGGELVNGPWNMKHFEEVTDPKYIKMEEIVNKEKTNSYVETSESVEASSTPKKSLDATRIAFLKRKYKIGQNKQNGVNIKLNYKCKSGTVDESNRCKEIEKTVIEKKSVFGLPENFKLGKEVFSAFHTAYDRNVFNFSAIKSKYDNSGNTYEVTVEPKKIPESWKKTEEGDAWYDPDYYHEIPLSEGSVLKVLRRTKEYNDSLDGKEPGKLFRGMSYDEFENIQKNGYIQSKGDYNFDNQEGLTYFSLDKGQASYYASGFAPWQYKATLNKPAVMISIKEPNASLQDTSKASGSDEVGVKGKVNAKDIIDVYFGYPVAFDIGSFDVRQTTSGTVLGSSRGYEPKIRWEKIEQKQNDVFVEPIIDRKDFEYVSSDENSETNINKLDNIKMNYKCKKEESPDGNSNKCIDKESKLESGELADKSIVTGIDKINKMGLKTIASCSGLKKEHDEDSIPYLSIKLPSDLNDINKIKDMSIKSGFNPVVSDDDKLITLYMSDTSSVETDKLVESNPLVIESNRKLKEIQDDPKYATEDFFAALEEHDSVRDQVIEKYGGKRTDESKIDAWDNLVKNLSTAFSSESKKFTEVSTSFNEELGGFHTTDYKTSKDKSLRVISQDKNDNSKLLKSIEDISSEKLPKQFLVMKMINDVPAKYYAKTDSIGVNKKLSSEEMKTEIEKVLNSVKHNAFVEYVVPENEIRMNYRCKKGTVDDTFKCPNNEEDKSSSSSKTNTINELLNEYKNSKTLISKIVESSDELKKDDRPVVHLGDLDGISEGMKSFKKFDTWRGLKDYKLELFKDDDGGIVASVAGQEVGYIKMLNDNSIDLTVAEEMQFNGIGTLMSVEFFKEHPDAMFKTGGLTPSGKRSISKVVKQLYNEKLLSEKVTPTKNKKIDFKNSETTNKFINIYKNDKNVFDKAEDQAIMSYAHERSADLPPKVVSTRSFNEYVKNGATELFRGTTKEYANKFESDPNFYMGSGIHGSGVYTAYGNMGRDVAKHYAGNSDDAHVIRLALSKDAKIIGVQEIEDMMNEEMKELNKDTVRYEDLERSTGKNREKLQEKYEEDAAKRNLMYDPGRFALIKGYDAINIPDLEFVIVLNRSKVIVEKVKK